MERDYSGWFVKYHIDLGDISNAFPQIVLMYRDPSDLNYYRFAILGLIREEDDDDNSFLVLSLPSNAIR
ncbi:hypothetical protein HYC85_014093 [Camellia sinensis]|uniref:Uncharacterized protein n=1 Tax=Camellia sinensis TaxID=4442 RepID=A0A7J7H8L5_CAMSI|nr:hypothetical protein HYC85_014093 [Camellia sinensis]